MRAEAYPDLGLEHNYCRNDPSIASFGFESYPRRLYDGLHAWVPGIARTSRYRVTTPAYLQTRTAPWRGMSKVPAWRRRSTAGASPPQPHGRATHSEGPAARSKQHEASTASSKQARSRANLPCYIPPAAGGSLGPSAHSTQAPIGGNGSNLRLDTPRWCYVEPESVAEDEEVAWCHRTRRKHGYLHRPTDHGMWDCTSGICVATGSGTIRQDWPACGSASNRSAFRNNNVDGCGWPWGSRGDNSLSPALTSEEALQQAQAEGLTLRAAENRTGYLGVYYSNMHVERARTRYFGVYLDTTYGHHSKPYKARVNRSNSGELDEWGLHNSSHLADYTTAEAAALAIARNAVEEEWRAHGCEARALRKEVRTLSKYKLASAPSKQIVARRQYSARPGRVPVGLGLLITPLHWLLH